MNKNPDEFEQIEHRFVEKSEVRAASVDGKPVIEGLGAVYNQEADLGYFTEIILPGFFEDVLENDVRGLFNHNTDNVLGRTLANTMRVADSEKGLAYSIDVNEKDPFAMSVYAKCERGDVSQSSFSFALKSKSRGDAMDGDEWFLLGDKVVRRLLKGGCKELYDTGPVTFPAYEQTSANARSKAEEIRKSADLTAAPGQASGAQAATAKAQAQARQRARGRKLALAEKSYPS